MPDGTRLTPVAVMILATLREGDMHTYELVRLLRERKDDRLVPLQKGTIYHTVARLERDGAVDAAAVHEAFDRLKTLSDGWHDVEPGEAIREAAVRFLRVHPLRAADALQLAAAFIAAERRPSSLAVLTLDDRLAAAASKEGFRLVAVPSAG